MKKALVVGIIVLFLGVGFQPALANEVSTNIVSDVDEDCLECQPVNRADLLRVRLLLIRLEVFINIVLSIFGHIPKIVTICEEILEILKNGIKDIICNILLNPLYRLMVILFILWTNAKTDLGGLFVFPYMFIKQIFENIYNQLNCDNWEPPIGKASSSILGISLNQIRDNVVDCPCMQR